MGNSKDWEDGKSEAKYPENIIHCTLPKYTAVSHYF